jgi:hypothetical protein
MIRFAAAPRFTALAVAACAVLLPASGAFLRSTAPDLGYENRNASRWPAGMAMSSDLLRNYQDFFGDRLGWRGNFIALRNRIYDALGMSPNPLSRTGRDGWLLTTANSALLDRAGLMRFDDETIRRFRSQIDARVNFWRRRGTQYYLLLGPEKSSIYPEQLGGFFPVNETAFEQAYRMHGADVFGPHFIDPRKVMQDDKRRVTYYETDSHWNVLGARIAYRRLIDSIAADFPNVSAIPDDLYSVRLKVHKGDLVPHGLEDSYAKLAPYIDPPAGGCGTRRELDAKDWPDLRLRVPSSVAHCATGKLTALVVHDSFGAAMQPFLTRTFAKTVFAAMPVVGDVPGELVEDAAKIVGPIDIIVQIRVERAFLKGRLE